MPDFNGNTLTITLDSGVTNVDLFDNLYEPWKDWLLANPQNRRFPQAFRSDGGNPLSAIINQGSYIFLNNAAGWRIKPPEEDITIYLTGNLAVEDTTLPAFAPTVGTFTTAILGLQPVTQGVTETMASQLEYASFAGGVWVDQAGSNTGTGYAPDGHPIGSPSDPVNNFADARIISLSRGLPPTFFIIGNATLDTGDDVSGFKLVGQGAARSMITMNAGANTLNAEITEAAVTGTLDGQTIIRNSVVTDLNFFNGFIHECEINGTITLGGGLSAAIYSCYSGVPGASTPTIDMGGSGQSLGLRRYSGGIKIVNKTGADGVSIDLIGGQVQIDLTTVTNGTVVVRGNGKVVNAANTEDHLLHGMYGSLYLDNETTSGLMIQDLWLLQGLDPDNALTVTPSGRTAGEITQTITGDGETTTTVTRT